MSALLTDGTLAFLMGSPSPMEMIVVALIALLLFGKRLPEVARSLGKGIVEFKKGVRGIEDEVDDSVYTAEPARRPEPRNSVAETTAPRFEPPQSAPQSADVEQEHDQTV